jgi:hypothetical protein
MLPNLGLEVPVALQRDTMLARPARGKVVVDHRILQCAEQWDILLHFALPTALWQATSLLYLPGSGRLSSLPSYEVYPSAILKRLLFSSITFFLSFFRRLRPVFSPQPAVLLTGSRRRHCGVVPYQVFLVPRCQFQCSYSDWLIDLPWHLETRPRNHL